MTRKLFIALTSLTMLHAHGAQAAPITIDGGVLDSTIADADIYVGTPAEAAADGAACRLAQQYIKLVRAGQYKQVAELFTTDAAVLEPTRQQLQGREAIIRFYEKTIGPMQPDVIGVSYIGNDTDCMVSIAVRIKIDSQPRYKLASVDHFRLDHSGKAVRMVAYVRPGAAVSPH